MGSITKKIGIYDQGETENTVLKETTRIMRNRYYTTKAEAKGCGHHENPEKQFEIEIKVRRV